MGMGTKIGVESALGSDAASLSSNKTISIFYSFSTEMSKTRFFDKFELEINQNSVLLKIVHFL